MVGQLHKNSWYFVAQTACNTNFKISKWNITPVVTMNDCSFALTYKYQSCQNRVNWLVTGVSVLFSVFLNLSFKWQYLHYIKLVYLVTCCLPLKHFGQFCVNYISHLKFHQVYSVDSLCLHKLQLCDVKSLSHCYNKCLKNFVNYLIISDTLRHEVISGPSFFIKQSGFLITMATELFCSLGSNIPGLYKQLLSHPSQRDLFKVYID